MGGLNEFYVKFFGPSGSEFMRVAPTPRCQLMHGGGEVLMQKQYIPHMLTSCPSVDELIHLDSVL